MAQVLRRLVLLAGLATLAGCADNPQQPDVTTPTERAPAGTTLVPGTPSHLTTLVPPPCPATQALAQQAIDQLLPQLFAPGNGRRGKAQGLSNGMEKARYANDVNLANIKSDSLINFTLQQYFSGQLLNQGSDLAGTQQRIVDFITYIYCFNGYSPLPDFDEILNAQTSVLIRNVTPTTVVNDDQKKAGVKIDQGDVPATVDGQPFFGTYVSIVKTTNPLPTSLDWYGIDGYKAGAFEFIADPEVTFTDVVLTGACISYDDAIVTSPNDLRLAHTAPANPADVASGNAVVTTTGGSIEIGAPAAVGPLGLACTPLPIASATALGRAMDQFAALFLPPDLLAATTGGSVGTAVKKFSPFAAVDIRLATSSTGPASPVFIPLGSTTTSAPVTLSAKTRNGHTAINNIPVAFATGVAGSSFSPASANTDNAGLASSSWTLVAGANSGTGTPSLAPLVFTPATASYAVNVIQETPLSFDAPATLPNGQLNTAYPSTTFSASGGIGTFAWAVTSGSLPTGLTLTAGGTLSGTPTASGIFTFDVTVTSGGQTQSRSYSVTIALPPVTIVTTSPLPAATVGASYSRTLQATGGAGAGSYAWTLGAGTLPAGLGLSPAGVISGTPTATGTFTFTVQVTSGTGAAAVTSSKSFSLTVSNPTAINISFDVAPSKQQCYALGVPMSPGIKVRVTDQSGNLLTGVTVNMTGVTNNGSTVVVSPSSAVSSSGIASFGGPSINKTGGYALVASTAAPWPAASVTSAKFTISPSCS